MQGGDWGDEARDRQNQPSGGCWVDTTKTSGVESYMIRFAFGIIAVAFGGNGTGNQLEAGRWGCQLKALAVVLESREEKGLDGSSGVRMEGVGVREHRAVGRARRLGGVPMSGTGVGVPMSSVLEMLSWRHLCMCR